MEIFRRLLRLTKFANFLNSRRIFAFLRKCWWAFSFQPWYLPYFSLANSHMGLFLIARPLLCSLSAVNPTGNPPLPIARLRVPPPPRVQNQDSNSGKYNAADTKLRVTRIALFFSVITTRFKSYFPLFPRHCFNCRPSDSSPSEDSKIEPCPVAVLHWHSWALTTRLNLVYIVG